MPQFRHLDKDKDKNESATQSKAKLTALTPYNNSEVAYHLFPMLWLKIDVKFFYTTMQNIKSP
ncbi:hypothetical protein CY0110_09607 [Crocosphaera chwakensis CCY0110]|uniref:Uncharacterized protein n=1 Tax=Crocosphaera chwakensis CCY0110 TaxID=391612 RepID=A3IGM8_9CHRO|nr:hypothetical protein CY0110_09607 [Crocosphaera chwakensis CCY0110]